MGLGFAGCASGPVGAGFKLPPSPTEYVWSREYSQRERSWAEAVAQHLQLEPGVWLGIWTDDRGTGLPAFVRAVTPNSPGADPGVVYLFHGDTRRLAWIRAHKYRPFRLAHVRFVQVYPGDRLIGDGVFDRLLVVDWPGDTGRTLLSASRRAMAMSGILGVVERKGAPSEVTLRRMAKTLGLLWTGKGELGDGSVLHVFSRTR
ncbi:MAG: hypothetical protein HYY84_00305 [Deltaproteobacteria bacterium]|nr:hypothetical protein [Deltaproteobacteria bacterium]